MIISTSEQSLCNTLLALCKRKETCSKLQEIKAPALIIVGKEDKVTPPAAAKFMHEKIKGSCLGIIKHAGHLSNMENPDVFGYQVKKFVSSVY
jgi:pimeloyl-ACP methyl ester carboxylesterase